MDYDNSDLDTIEEIDQYCFLSTQTKHKNENLYFAVEIHTKKYFQNERCYNAEIVAKIRYITHIKRGQSIVDNEGYEVFMAGTKKTSQMDISYGGHSWKFGSYVAIPQEYQSLNVGRTVLNLILKKAKEISPDSQMGGQLEGGDPAKYAARNPFYENIGFIFTERRFHIDKIANLKTFDAISDIHKVNIEDEFSKIQEENIAIKSRNKVLIENQKETFQEVLHVQKKLIKCTKYRNFLTVLSVLIGLWIVFH